jgi:hypothetical protein
VCVLQSVQWQPFPGHAPRCATPCNCTNRCLQCRTVSVVQVRTHETVFRICTLCCGCSLCVCGSTVVVLLKAAVTMLTLARACGRAECCLIGQLSRVWCAELTPTHRLLRTNGEWLCLLRRHCFCIRCTARYWCHFSFSESSFLYRRLITLRQRHTYSQQVNKTPSNTLLISYYMTGMTCVQGVLWGSKRVHINNNTRSIQRFQQHSGLPRLNE